VLKYKDSFTLSLLTINEENKGQMSPNT